MEGGIGRRKRRRRAGSSASRLSYGQWISWDNWLKVSLSVLLLWAVCKWLSGLVLCCVSRVIYQVCREETEGGQLQQQGRQQLPACWLGVLTPHLTCMGTEQPPLLSSPPGRLWEQEVQIFILPLSLSLSASCWAVKLWEAALDRAGHDKRGQLWQRPQRETWVWRIALPNDSWIRNGTVGRVTLSASQPCSCLVSHQPVSCLVSRLVNWSVGSSPQGQLFLFLHILI